MINLNYISLSRHSVHAPFFPFLIIILQEPSLPFHSVFFASCWSDVKVPQRCKFPCLDLLLPCFSSHYNRLTFLHHYFPRAVPSLPFPSVFVASCWSEDVKVPQRCTFPYLDFLFPCFSSHDIYLPTSSVS